MQLNNKDRLIIQLLCSIREHLKIEDEFDSKFISKMTAYGADWAIDQKYSGLWPHVNEKKPEHVCFVADVLDMWLILQEQYNLLGSEDKEKLLSTELTFAGFDGNNEREYCNVCDILIDDMKRFKTLKKISGFNSHIPRVGKYKKMLDVFEPLRSQIPDKKLSLMEIQSVLNA